MNKKQNMLKDNMLILTRKQATLLINKHKFGGFINFGGEVYLFAENSDMITGTGEIKIGTLNIKS